MTDKDKAPTAQDKTGAKATPTTRVTTDSTSGRTAEKESTADKEPLTAGPPPEDTQYVDEVPTQRGRKHPTVFGSGEPSEPETFEQGMVRTGRKLPEHHWGEDSAGLTKEETERRQKQSRDQRMDLVHELEEQGSAASGDSVGPRVTRRPHEPATDEKERQERAGARK